MTRADFVGAGFRFGKVLFSDADFPSHRSRQIGCGQHFSLASPNYYTICACYWPTARRFAEQTSIVTPLGASGGPGWFIYFPSHPAYEIFLTGAIAPSLQTVSAFRPLVAWSSNIDRRSAQPRFWRRRFSHLHHRCQGAFGFNGVGPADAVARGASEAQEAEAVVDFAGLGAAGGGDLVEGLAAVGAVAGFEDAGVAQDAELLGGEVALQIDGGGDVADAGGASIGEPAHDMPARDAPQREEEGHGIRGRGGRHGGGGCGCGGIGGRIAHFG